jgi:hypothetical protein
MGEATKQRRSKAKQIFFLVLSWGAALIILEAGVRFLKPEVGQPVYPGYPDGLVTSDEELGHAHVADFSGFFPTPEYSEISIRINGFGFRDDAWTRNPNPARPRILALGDSITFGSPVTESERFTEQAEALLSERGTPVEICNVGVNGYNVEQYEILTRKLGPELLPKMVLVGLCLNDAEPLAPDDGWRIETSRGARAGSSLASLRQALYRNHLDLGQSYAWNLGRRAFKIWLWSRPETREKLVKQYDQNTQIGLARLYQTGLGKKRLRVHLGAMKDFAQKELGAKIAVVIFAYQSQLETGDPSVGNEAEAVLDELSIPYVNLYKTFLPHRQDEGLYAKGDDCHPGPPGHRIAGEATAGLIEQVLAAEHPTF